MKKYHELQIIISMFEREDVVCASGPDGENTLPWVDITASKGTLFN